MGRKIMTVVDAVESVLADLVKSYGQAKAELDEVKGRVDSLNKELKETMAENDIKDFSAGGYKVKYIVSEKESVNEDKLLGLLSTKHKDTAEQLGFVKMKPYVDFDAIEKEIYNGNVSEELLADIGTCRETKEVVSVRLSKEKEK